MVVDIFLKNDKLYCIYDDAIVDILDELKDCGLTYEIKRASTIEPGKDGWFVIFKNEIVGPFRFKWEALDEEKDVLLEGFSHGKFEK